MNIIQKLIYSMQSKNEDNSIPARFERFHQDNPDVYRSLVLLTRQVMERNKSRKIGIGMMYEVLRWQYYINSDAQEDYKLPNEYRACYARKIMAQESDLAGCFNTRKSVADIKL